MWKFHIREVILPGSLGLQLLSKMHQIFLSQQSNNHLFQVSLPLREGRGCIHHHYYQLHLKWKTKLMVLHPNANTKHKIGTCYIFSSVVHDNRHACSVHDNRSAHSIHDTRCAIW